MRITWVIEGHGGGRADVEDVEQAARRLAAAVRAAYGQLDATALSEVLLGVVAPLRHQLVTDGRMAVEQGNEWSAGRGGVVVTLYPNQGSGGYGSRCD